jgi:hypothetical protein
MKKLSKTVHVLQSRARVEGGVLRLVGEVFNNSTKTVGSVFVTAKIYNASGGLLATRTARTELSYMPVGSRAPFSISGTLPAGYHHVSWSVTASPTTRLIGAPTATYLTRGLNGTGHYVVTGTVRNPYATSVNTLRVAATLYDARGGVLDVIRASVGATILAAGASTSYSATFLATGLTPDKVYVRGMVFR